MALGPVPDAVAEQGTIFGTLAFLGGMAFVFPLFVAAGGDLEAQALATPLAMAAFGYMLLHAWGVLFGLPPDFLAFALVPALLLALVGYVTARRTRRLDMPGRYRGAGVVFGYLPVTGLAFVYVVVRFQQLAPDGRSPLAVIATLDPGFLVASVGYTGLLFPLLFGGLGGYVAERREN